MLPSLLRRRFAATLALFALGTVGSACADDTSETNPTSSSNTGGNGTGAGGTGGSDQGDPIKILNWNIRNFLDDQNDGLVPGEIVKTPEEFQAQVAAAAAILAELDPDVAVLQEIENDNVLDALNTALGNRYPTRVSLPGNDPRGANLAALSKLPFDAVVSHKDDTFVEPGSGATFTFTRDCAEFHLTHAGQPIVLLGVHYKAKENDNPNRRLAEAYRTREIADGLTAANPELGVIVLGDFNDLPGSDPYLVVAGPESDRYIDVVDVLPQEERWTFDYLGAKELIDHQMANPNMYGFLDPASVMIRKGVDVGTASDHFPIIATYRVR
jgi:endonuclease/exonuclease/phosphatase family metal-dependent hydrolase